MPGSQVVKKQRERGNTKAGKMRKKKKKDQKAPTVFHRHVSDYKTEIGFGRDQNHVICEVARARILLVHRCILIEMTVIAAITLAGWSLSASNRKTTSNLARVTSEKVHKWLPNAKDLRAAQMVHLYWSCFRAV